MRMKRYLILPLLIKIFFICDVGHTASTKLHQNFMSYYKVGLKYSLMSIAKEIIARDPVSVAGLDAVMEDVVLAVGSRNFQGFRNEQLQKHHFNFIHYVVGRKYFQQSKWEKAESSFKKVSSSSKFYPMVLQALATIAAQHRQEEKAQILFEKCTELASQYADKNEHLIAKQYNFVSYQCHIGKARVLYGMRKYKEAESHYQTLSKKSYLWPIILVEESWNSYQQKAYNRSLGKVATYKAPQLRYAYRPEVDVVRAMSYLEMCLYDDATETVNSFYKLYEPLAKYLEGTLSRYSKDVVYYYNLAKTGVNQDGPYNDFIQGTLKDPDTYLINQNLEDSHNEANIIQNKYRGKSRDVLESTILDYQESQRSMLGRLIRTKFKKFSVDIREALQDMSYIKLEIIGRKKSAIYQGKELVGKRGDVEYLKKTRSQYFWNFRNEFWADELGDYVFALANECGNSRQGGN